MFTLSAAFTCRYDSVPHLPHRLAVPVALVALAALPLGLTAPASADPAMTTIDVLTVLDGRYSVETVTVPARDAATTAADLEDEPQVVAASPQVVYQVAGKPDPYWAADDPGETSHVRDTWSRTRGAGQIVAVLDTAAQLVHEDLVGAVVPGTDVAGGPGDPWHGTGVAGVVAARADNGIGSAGMAPEAKVMPVRVCNDGGCSSAAVARGVLWAADHGADVINLSLAGAGYSDVTALAIQYALGKNISVVASTGNDGLNGNPVMYPAANSGVIAVSATTAQGAPADWAVHGWQADIATVGDSVLLTMPGNGYGNGSGTSFSGPAVAGAVALLRSSHPGIGPDAVQAALQAGAESAVWDRAWGAGRLDVPAAMSAADRLPAAPPVTGSPQALDVAWPAVPGATSYRVRVDGVLTATTSDTSAHLTGLTDGNQLAVDVQPDGAERSRPALATVGAAAPATPHLISAVLSGTSTSAVVELTATVDGPAAAKHVLIRDGVSSGSFAFALSGTPKTVRISIGAMPTYRTSWQLSAVDSLGRTSAPSNAVAAGSGAPAAPPAVTGLGAQVDGDRVLLTWDDLGAGHTYEVRTGGDLLTSPRTAGAVVPAPPVNGRRTYEVSAVDTWGQVGPAASTEVSRVGSLGPPLDVSAGPGDGSATVSWTAPVSGGAPITGYTVTAAPGGRTVATTGATTATVTGLTNGTAYTFTVTATNSTGTSPASTPSAAVTPAGPPGAPSGVAAVPGNGTATVGWTASAANGAPITGYTVTTSPGGRTATTTGATTATVTGLTNGTAYTFTVTATNAVGTGSASARSTAVTPATKPGTPNIGTPSGGNASAVVRWTAPSNGGKPITGYTLRTYKGATLVTTTTAGATATSSTITGLSNGTAFTFTVAATNAVGTGSASAHSAAVRPAPTKPAAPKIGAASAGNGSAVVRWTAPSNGGSAITGYTLRTYKGTTLVTTTTAGATATSSTITGLTNGTAYTVTVAAKNAVGTSTASAHSAAVKPATRPGAPRIGSPSAGRASAVVRWTAPASSGGSTITGYTIRTYRGTALVKTTTASASARSLTVTGLTNGTAYSFTVAAKNSVGTGGASARSGTVKPHG